MSQLSHLAAANRTESKRIVFTDGESPVANANTLWICSNIGLQVDIETKAVSVSQ